MSGVTPRVSASEMTEEQLTNLSDEEFLKLEEPSEGALMSDVSADVTDVSDEEADGEDPASLGSAEEGDEDQGEEVGDTKSDSDESDEVPEDLGEDLNDKGKGDKPEDKTTDTDKTKKTPAAAEETAIDYKAVYEQIFAPIKANGRQIQLKTPAEVISLIQMGANYTQKLQALQPTLKMVRMLENQGLMSEEKLTFLIDVNRRDPAAIAKLLKEGNIDPLEIDTQSEPSYKPGNHRVTDEDMAFVDTIRDVNSSPEGAKLIREIDSAWDEPSKKAIWKEPGILTVLKEHRENGIYARVAAEVERRRMFGDLTNVPFLQAYYATAKTLQEQGQLATKTSTTQAEAALQEITGGAPQRQGRVLDQRAAVRKPTADADRIRAAQPTRAAAQKVQSDFNPLAMSDEEFEKSAHLAMKL